MSMKSSRMSLPVAFHFQMSWEAKQYRENPTQMVRNDMDKTTSMTGNPGKKRGKFTLQSEKKILSKNCVKLTRYKYIRVLVSKETVVLRRWGNGSRSLVYQQS